MPTRKAKISTALVALGSALLSAGVYIAPMVKSLAHEYIPQVAREYLDKIGILEKDRLDGEWWVSVYYPHDPQPVQTWKVRLHGNYSLSGEVQFGKARGVANGYFRNDTLTIAYASQDPSRPGYGTYILDQRHTADGTTPPAYVGAAIVHECLSKDGQTCQRGPRSVCPALLTKDQPADLQLTARFFNRSCTQVAVNWPGVAASLEPVAIAELP